MLPRNDRHDVAHFLDRLADRLAHDGAPDLEVRACRRISRALHAIERRIGDLVERLGIATRAELDLGAAADPLVETKANGSRRLHRVRDLLAAELDADAGYRRMAKRGDRITGTAQRSNSSKSAWLARGTINVRKRLGRRG